MKIFSHKANRPMNPEGYTGFLIVTFPWLVVFLLLRAFISSQFILTSAPGKNSACKSRGVISLWWCWEGGQEVVSFPRVYPWKELQSGFLPAEGSTNLWPCTCSDTLGYSLWKSTRRRCGVRLGCHWNTMWFRMLFIQITASVSGSLSNIKGSSSCLPFQPNMVAEVIQRHTHGLSLGFLEESPPYWLSSVAWIALKPHTHTNKPGLSRLYLCIFVHTHMDIDDIIKKRGSTWEWGTWEGFKEG